VGSKSFSVTATDFAGHSSSASATYHVVGYLAVSPALLAIGDTATATSPLDGTFLSAVIDWGDGTTCSVGTTGCTVSPEGTLTATHAYGAPGVYTVTLTVVYEGLTLTDTFEFVVVYDPSAGFVTGGGEFDSLPGADRLDTSAQGLAKFGFVSRYKRGTSVPSGNTAFEFSAGDLKFRSTSYEWLVISGSTARFKGVGTINGSGEFGFILSAFDADLNTSDSFTDDLFRIKIWDVAAGETVYDTSCDSDGVCEADLPSDAKKGAVPIRGSIKIHQ
jgi:PKD repeat protein